MNSANPSRTTNENLSKQIAGTYEGYAKYVESNNGLGTKADRWVDYLIVAPARVTMANCRGDEINILIRLRNLPDFEFRNNLLIKNGSSSKCVIEGDWVTGWGIIGCVDQESNKLVIDINPYGYTKAQNCGLRSEDLVNRYVIRTCNDPFSYKTVFNLEFEGVLVCNTRNS